MTIQIAPALAALIHELEQLPGLGPLSAQRVAYWLLKDSESRITPLEAALADARQNIGRCPHCNSFTIKGQLCAICQDEQRDHSIMCVVESAADQQALESSFSWGGLYFVLTGHLNPIEGQGATEIGLPMLLERVEKGLKEDQLREVVIATSYTPEGDATAYYIIDLLQKRFPELRVTRLARGLPTGIEIKYTDLNTIANAVYARKEVSD